MAQPYKPYISKFSGVNIDRAVAYYNGIQALGRTIKEFGVDSSDDWESAASEDPFVANYKVVLSTQGSGSVANATFSNPPYVYFLDRSGLKWEVEYKCVSTDNVYTITCYSNKKISGKFVVVSVLSDKDTVVAAGENQ